MCSKQAHCSDSERWEVRRRPRWRNGGGVQMVTITESTSIDRPVEEVWRFVSDPGNTPKWYQGTLAVGTMFAAAVRYRGRSLVFGARCTAVDPNNEVTWGFTSGPTKGSKDTWRMEPNDETSTRLTRIFELRVSGAWRVIQPMIARGTKRAHEAEIHNVKRILEGEPQAERGERFLHP